MSFTHTIARRMMGFCAFALLTVPCHAQFESLDLPSQAPVPESIDLNASFSFRMCVRLSGQHSDLPLIAANKAWESGAVRDYTTNNSYGLGRESGSLAGFAISVLPDGAWTWNAGDGSARIDHRPESPDQGISDGEWHEVGFAIDRSLGVAHLYRDGRRVALHDLQGVDGLATGGGVVRLGDADGLEIADVRIESGVVGPSDVLASFVERFGEERLPAHRHEWNGEPLKVLAWNIWHGGRRKGDDEGVQRVVEVIEAAGADIVLMQETYGSGPRISGRLGFDYCLRSSNLSVLSRYPIVDVHRLYSGFRFGGVTIELAPGTEIQAYSLWINYLPSVSKALSEGATAPQLAAADAATRGREIDAILDELVPHIEAAPTTPVIVGGDFNSGSHLDWTSRAADAVNHHGHVVRWPVSLSMERAGFVDTFRAAHSDPLARPGWTWSPEFPDSHQDRIDYVYVRAGDWRVVDSEVLRTHPRGWPSDHAAVLSTLELVEPPRPLEVMSYNIHYGVGMDEAFDLGRIAQVINEEAPDIVGLQEIGNKAMAQELGRLTEMRSVFGASKGSDDAYGDAILCRYPFEWVGNLALPSASSSRYQAMAVDIDLTELYGDGATVRFVNTHFDWLDSLGSKAARRASVDVIEQGLCANLSGPAILTGDLNALPGSPPLVDLEEYGWFATRLQDSLLTFDAAAPTRQIDYALVRPRASWRILDARVVHAPLASDHLPIVLSLRPVDLR